MSDEHRSEASLRELLARLHQRLGQAGSVDAQSRKLLTELVRDVDGALARDRARDAGAAGTHAHRLESLAVRFEADHPALAEVIREVMDALVKAGI